MHWDQLLHNGRRKDKSKSDNKNFGNNGWGLKEGTIAREEIERDFDRILFLAPTRRLADKTQVFPLEQNDSVRTRLTHSHEVANLARSIGTQLAYQHEKLFSENPPLKREGKLTRTLPSLLAAIGLAHDLGNPPFGHQGESAIQDWFATKSKAIFPQNENGEIPYIYNDFIKFDGNSQTIRLLTQLQVLNDKFGVNLTYATLAAMLKYPQSSEYIAKRSEDIRSWKEKNKNSFEECPFSKVTWKKHGYFHSESQIIEDLWAQTGLKEGVRHPLTYIMEACDDIAYSVLDAEDIVKKGLASFHDLMNHLKHYMKCATAELKTNDKLSAQSKRDKKAKFQLIRNTINASRKKHLEFSANSLNLTPAELNDVSMQMFRVYAISELVPAITDAFAQNASLLMDNEKPIKDLISHSHASELCEALKEFDLKWGYKNKTVLKLELEGHNYIHSLMDMLWVGIHGRLSRNKPHRSQTPFGKYAYGRISENYRRVFEDTDNELPEAYKEAQLLTDAISGMTDSYLIDLHNELIALYKQP